MSLVGVGGPPLQQDQDDLSVRKAHPLRQ